MPTAEVRLRNGVVIAAERPSSPEWDGLVAERAAHYAAIYGEAHRPPPIDLNARHLQTYALRRDTRLVGFGCLIAHPGFAELKHLFVSAPARGLGLGAALAAALEGEAARAGYRLVRLEVGTRQKDAVALYARLGYRPCSVFGTYRVEPDSLFLEKTVPAPP